MLQERNEEEHAGHVAGDAPARQACQRQELRCLGDGGAIHRLPDEQPAAPRELRETGVAEDALDRADADLDALVVEDLGDLAGGDGPLPSQLDDAGADLGGRAAPGVGQVGGAEGEGELAREEAMAEEVDVAGAEVEAFSDDARR